MDPSLIGLIVLAVIVVATILSGLFTVDTPKLPSFNASANSCASPAQD